MGFHDGVPERFTPLLIGGEFPLQPGVEPLQDRLITPVNGLGLGREGSQLVTEDGCSLLPCVIHLVLGVDLGVSEAVRQGIVNIRVESCPYKGGELAGIECL